MSWLEKIKDDLIIITGDGEQYKPSWINASRSKEFNVSEFEFVELAGTLVDRRKPKGNRYNLEIHFQGENHLDAAQQFYNSCDNNKYWTLTHPFYGRLYVQPLSLNQDNTVYNISKFTIPIVETIIDDNPKTSTTAFDSIITNKLVFDEDAELVLQLMTQETANIVEDNNNKTFNSCVKIIKLPEEFQEFNNLFNAANTAIDTSASSAQLAMRASISLITAPAKFTATVTTRLNALTNQFVSLRTTVVNLLNPASKKTYETLGSALISSMCLVVTTPNGNDFSNNKKVAKALQTIQTAYNDLLTDLDSLQSYNGASPESYVPDFNLVSSLNDLINSTTSYLFLETISAKKERSVILTEDTNIVLLTNKYYGLDINDANIDEMIENNDLSLDELVIINKGRKIIYYI